MILDPRSSRLPTRQALPPAEDGPDGAAWFWGPDDELGRLNMLTSERTARAAKLIRTGHSICLEYAEILRVTSHLRVLNTGSYRIDLPEPPMFARESFKHTIKPLGPLGNDDLYSMNTQSGSQWDGFRHVSAKHGDKWIFYNNTTQDDILHSSRIGMQAWAKHGIVGRGVLIDWWSYCGKSYDPNKTHAISVQNILDCARAQRVEFEYGDILIIRSGWIDTYNGLTTERRKELGGLPYQQVTHAGVEQTPEMLDFLHDNYFSAVAGDSPAFESWPSDKDWNLHHILLPLWGLPIGEMWDLEALSEKCKETGQYQFFLCSSPTNCIGGVGSYSNARAVF